MSKKKVDPTLSKKLLEMLGDDDSELGQSIKSMLPIFNTVFKTLLQGKEPEKKDSKIVVPMSSGNPPDPFQTIELDPTTSASNYHIPDNTWNDLLGIASKYLGIPSLVDDEDNDQTMCDSDGNKFVDHKEAEEQEYSQEDIQTIAEDEIVTNVAKYDGIDYETVIDKIYKHGLHILWKCGITNWKRSDIEDEFNDVDDQELEEIINDSKYYHYFELIG